MSMQMRILLRCCCDQHISDFDDFCVTQKRVKCAFIRYQNHQNPLCVDDRGDVKVFLFPYAFGIAYVDEGKINLCITKS